MTVVAIRFFMYFLNLVCSIVFIILTLVILFKQSFVDDRGALAFSQPLSVRLQFRSYFTAPTERAAIASQALCGTSCHLCAALGDGRAASLRTLHY